MVRPTRGVFSFRAAFRGGLGGLRTSRVRHSGWMQRLLVPIFRCSRSTETPREIGQQSRKARLPICGSMSRVTSVPVRSINNTHDTHRDGIHQDVFVLVRSRAIASKDAHFVLRGVFKRAVSSHRTNPHSDSLCQRILYHYTSESREEHTDHAVMGVVG